MQSIANPREPNQAGLRILRRSLPRRAGPRPGASLRAGHALQLVPGADGGPQPHRPLRPVRPRAARGDSARRQEQDHRPEHRFNRDDLIRPGLAARYRQARHPGQRRGDHPVPQPSQRRRRALARGRGRHPQGHQGLLRSRHPRPRAYHRFHAGRRLLTAMADHGAIERLYREVPQ